MEVGVIGSGKFGTTISKLLSENVNVCLYTRRTEVQQAVNEKHHYLGIDLSPRIRCTMDMEELVGNCDLIFPVVPSNHFRSMVRGMASLLQPRHIIIQCTKGLDVDDIDLDAVQRGERNIRPQEVKTMSDVILEETAVVRVGCLSGPNLSAEIMAGEPCATVIASRFDEVADIGKKVLQSDRFRVYSSRDLKGAEWGGVLKNCYAIASGMIHGMGFGYNLRAVLITRALSEMVKLANHMGSSKTAFFGMAGIGDMIATASVNKSRNFSVGEQLGKGLQLPQILSTMNEPAEGLRTIIIARELARHFGLHLPIIEILFHIIYEDMDKQKALVQLMNYPYTEDVDFL